MKNSWSIARFSRIVKYNVQKSCFCIDTINFIVKTRKKESSTHTISKNYTTKKGMSALSMIDLIILANMIQCTNHQYIFDQ